MHTEKCKKAIAALESITGAFAKTEQLAISTLKALLLPVGEHGSYGSLLQDPSDVVGHGVSDGRVGGAVYLAVGYDVPEGDAAL